MAQKHTDPTDPDPNQVPGTSTVYKKAGDAHMSGEAELCFEIFAAMLAAVE